jgi:hypothetical protein
LRPDSFVAVVMLTDEDDSSPDPLSIGGQGWAFDANQFPGSPVFRGDGKTTTAPRATSVCKTNPGSPDCNSCGFGATCDQSDPACQKIRADSECRINNGFWGPNEDQLNARWQSMSNKVRYGVDPQYPIARYVDAFTKAKVPDRDSEHPVTVDPSGRRKIEAYQPTAKCRNPLFAAARAAACRARRRARAAAPRPRRPEIHMVQSKTPRPGLPGPNASDDADPINGREWDTQLDDLEFACVFALPTPHACVQGDASCMCGGTARPPLCNGTQQIKAKAYPTHRELRVAKGLGASGLVASICPVQLTDRTAPTCSRTSALNALVARMAPQLAH